MGEDSTHVDSSLFIVIFVFFFFLRNLDHQGQCWTFEVRREMRMSSHVIQIDILSFQLSDYVTKVTTFSEFLMSNGSIDISLCEHDQHWNIINISFYLTNLSRRRRRSKETQFYDPQIFNFNMKQSCTVLTENSHDKGRKQRTIWKSGTWIFFSFEFRRQTFSILCQKSVEKPEKIGVEWRNSWEMFLSYSILNVKELKQIQLH